MEELVKRLERVIQTGAPDKDGMHPISAEVVLEVVRWLSEHSTNLASLGTDCISRQAAIDALTDENIIKHMDSVHDSELHRCKRAFERILSQMPPVQPNSGKWIDTGSSEEWYAREYRCSECGGTMLGDANFCPNCGADMREVTT